MNAPILLVHGMFLTERSWAPWISFLEARGFAVTAPAWPGRERSAAECRAKPDALLRTLTLTELVSRYEAAARAHATPPILIGHSMGGLIVQLLLQRGVGRMGIVLSSAPPKGVSSNAWSHIRSNAPVLWPSSSPIVPSLAAWKYGFWHTASDAEARAAYDEHVVPESRKVGRGPIGSEAAIDFAKPRAPLLFIAAELDHIIPPALNRDNAARYRPEAGKTELIEVPGRTHYLASQPGWEEIADRCVAWIRSAA